MVCNYVSNYKRESDNTVPSTPQKTVIEMEVYLEKQQGHLIL